ncbi:hypothetical protein N656DRAFT_501640 [Canariomyces notabilis]|uniref:Uncharacterized protein n=1 Tax=Canariomyces notabilis TaxID=2074819 RepID=A0AAN6TJ34_9PEZI|nr:hypothetical protein N656DRAFT_501640 [Canariomyces arenarius]
MDGNGPYGEDDGSGPACSPGWSFSPSFLFRFYLSGPALSRGISLFFSLLGAWLALHPVVSASSPLYCLALRILLSYILSYCWVTLSCGAGRCRYLASYFLHHLLVPSPHSRPQYVRCSVVDWVLEGDLETGTWKS